MTCRRKRNTTIFRCACTLQRPSRPSSIGIMRRSASTVARAALRSISSRGDRCALPLAHLDLPASAPPGSATRSRIFFSHTPLEGRLRGPRPRAFSSSISDDHQERLFEHYAVGLRGILASVENLDDAKLAGKLRELRDDAPVELACKFWGAQFLAMAFGHEAGLAGLWVPCVLLRARPYGISM